MKKIFLAFSFWLIAFSSVQAAVINFSVAPTSASGGGEVSGEILVALTLDSEGQNINVVAGEIVIPAALQPGRILAGDSALKFWIEAPKFINHRLTFAGMIPGGAVTGHSPLFKFVVQGERSELARLTMSNLTVLLNDGEGTRTEARMAWRADSLSREEEIDLTPPEEFTPLIASDPTLFGGQKFLVFSTQDKQSGISHYEVCESGEGDFKHFGCNWQKTESPYLIMNQNLNERIKIKAVDLAGNERVVMAFSPPLTFDIIFFRVILIAVIILCFFGLKKLFYRR